MKLSEKMKEKQLLSFELFPPKTEKGMANLPGTIEHLMEFKPEYISCISTSALSTRADTTFSPNTHTRSNANIPRKRRSNSSQNISPPTSPTHSH